MWCHRSVRTQLTWLLLASACGAPTSSHRPVVVAAAPSAAPELSDDEKAARARFDRLLTSGGSLYAIDRDPTGAVCRRIRVDPERTKKHEGLTEGSFEWDVVRGDKVKGVRGLGYSLARDDDQIYITGPDTTWDDGERQAYGCLEIEWVTPTAMSIVIGSEMHFTPEDCTSALAAHTASTRTITGPSLGDC
jgi:hypothetical protein